MAVLMSKWLCGTESAAEYVEASSPEHAQEIASRRFGWRREQVTLVKQVEGSSTRVRLVGEVDPMALTKEDVAFELQVSARTIDRLIEKGTLRATRVGEQRRFHREDLTDLLRSTPSRRVDAPRPKDAAERILSRTSKGQKPAA